VRVYVLPALGGIRYCLIHPENLTKLTTAVRAVSFKLVICTGYSIRLTIESKSLKNIALPTAFLSTRNRMVQHIVVQSVRIFATRRDGGGGCFPSALPNIFAAPGRSIISERWYSNEFIIVRNLRVCIGYQTKNVDTREKSERNRMSPIFIGELVCFRVRIVVALVRQYLSRRSRR